MLLGSFYVVEATASEGVDPDELVSAIDGVLAEVKENGVTDDEVALAKINWEASFFRRLTTIGAKANLLNQYHIQTGDTDYIAKDLARFQNVTADGIKTAAGKLGAGRVVLHIGPEAADENTETEGK